jgi:hypothetical protein
MTEWVCDYAWARPDPHAIKAAGFKAVCRYLSHDTTGKTLSRAEVSRLHAANLGIVLNFEDSAGRAHGGYGYGLTDAGFANKLANDLGAPKEIPIYYSCDTDPGSPVNGNILDYFRGVKDYVGGRPVGAYGGAILIRQLFTNSYITYGWTANANSWNHGVPPVGHLHQVYGHPPGSPIITGASPQDYDVSEILHQYYGAWGLATPPEPEPVKPVLDLEDDGMFWYVNHDTKRGFMHDVWIDNDGEVQHMYDVGKVENLSDRVRREHGLKLGAMHLDSPVSFKIRPDSYDLAIDGYTVADNGWICHWTFEGDGKGGLTWYCQPVPPVKKN